MHQHGCHTPMPMTATAWRRSVRATRRRYRLISRLAAAALLLGVAGVALWQAPGVDVVRVEGRR